MPGTEAKAPPIQFLPYCDANLVVSTSVFDAIFELLLRFFSFLHLP